ncbi:MAG: pseudouridine synthase [Clostridia bacterium]|nr:pseudouridine synthase [Clostridia bacterium]
MPSMRLDKLLAAQGVCTRRELQRYLKAGRATVNGRVVSAPELKVDPAVDAVEFDGRVLQYREHVYYMLNKPAGVVSASSDPRERTVLDLLPPELRRPGLFPAGRLDKDTEGLLLITDDGAFAHAILSPHRHVAKCYFVTVDSSIGEDDRRSFSAGMTLSDGTQCLPAQLEPADEGDARQAFVTISEGKYHQIKRMFEAVGKHVIYLKRVSIGTLQLDKLLQRGEIKELKWEEIQEISKV